MPTVYAFDDPFGQGKLLFEAVKEAGGEAHLFSHPDAVPNQIGTHSFLTMPTYPRNRRDESKQFNTLLNMKDSVIQIPPYRDGFLHDDKMWQTLKFDKWMPKTWFSNEHVEALSLIEDIEYPCVSKAATGSGGLNNFFINDKPDAFAEIQHIFSAAGKMTYNKFTQKDYVIFQKIVERTNLYNWRITILGNRYAIISRRFKDDARKIVLNTSRFEMIDIMEDHLHDLLQYVATFTDDMKLRFVTINLMCGVHSDEKGEEIHRPYIISISANIDFEWYKTGGLIFERHADGRWISTGRPAMKVFDLLAEMILRGKFDYA